MFDFTDEEMKEINQEMMAMKLGFIGCGNMASAIMGGVIRNGIFRPEEMIGADSYKTALDKVSETLGIQVTTDNRRVAEECEVLVLSVKPQFYEEVIAQIRSAVDENKIIITIAPGKTLEWLGQKFEKPVKIVRTMPNTPALVGEGITAACANVQVSEEELAYVCSILRGFGEVEVIPEHLMDVVVSVSGSSPAYVFMMIEAMADAAVADGMARAQAYRFASQAVLGSAKMVLETGKHPGELKDMVCSPGGTTIEAVRVLEEKGFRSSLFEAMKACAKKAREM